MIDVLTTHHLTYVYLVDYTPHVHSMMICLISTENYVLHRCMKVYRHYMTYVYPVHYTPHVHSDDLFNINRELHASPVYEGL